MKTFRDWWLKHSGCESDDDERSADTKFSWDALPAAEHLLAFAEEWCKQEADCWTSKDAKERVKYAEYHLAGDLLEYLKAYIHGKQEA